MMARSATNQKFFTPSCDTQHDDLKSGLVTILLIAGVFIVARAYDPPTEPIFTLCLFREWTGLPCPGCGMTRSFCALAKGHWQMSFSFHPLGPATFVLLAAAWVRGLLLLLSCALAGRQISVTLRAIVSRTYQLAERLRLLQVGIFLLLSLWVVRLFAYAYSGDPTQLFREGLLSTSIRFVLNLSGFH